MTPCDHRFDADGRCSCGAEQCGAPVHWTRGGGPCAQTKPCRYHTAALITKEATSMNVHYSQYAALSPALPEVRDRLAAQNLAEYLSRLDTGGLIELLGALQAEASARAMCAAVAALGDAQSAAEDFAREQGR